MFLVTVLAGATVGYALQENFTLNFPQGNGTTTYITFESEQQQATQNLVGLLGVIMVFLVVGVVAYKKLRGD